MNLYERESSTDNPEFGKIHYHYYIDGKYWDHSKAIFYDLKIDEGIRPFYGSMGDLYKVVNISSKLLHDGKCRRIDLEFVCKGRRPDPIDWFAPYDDVAKTYGKMKK